MKILDLSLTYHWFDEIAAGRKKEEYRKRKPFYWKRFIYPDGLNYACYKGCTEYTTDNCGNCNRMRFRHYDAVRFHRGQGSRTTMLVECLGIHIGYGKEEWGAPKEKVFIIRLGKIITE